MNPVTQAGHPTAARGAMRRRKPDAASRGSHAVVRRGLRTLLPIGIVLLGCAGIAGCVPGANERQGERPSATGPVDANRLYQRQCAGCHGAYGEGNGPSAGMTRAANLTDPAFHERSTADSIAGVIRNGRGLMPPWSHLSDAEIDGLVVFVQSLGPEVERDGSGSDDNPVLTAE